MKRKIFLPSLLLFAGLSVFYAACSNADSGNESVVTEAEPIFEMSSSDVGDEGDIESSESGNGVLESSDSRKEDLDTNKFKAICESTGGTEKDGVCVCGEELCDVGAVCNTETKKCPDKNSPVVGECDDSYISTCENSGKGIGIVKECIKGVLVNRSCGMASCNEEATDCGECIDNVQTCTEDKNFKGTATRCERGKKVIESCGDYSCDPNGTGCGQCTNYGRSCVDDDEDKGTVYECIAGEAKKMVTTCGNKSCRADEPVCGECKNGELRCDNDINSNAIMYRCVNGQWERLHNRFDPLDKDYSCPAECRPTASAEDKDYCHNVYLCTDGCDPCVGDDYDEDYTADNSNPCYDAERCKKILAEEDPAYPPFRDYYTRNKWRKPLGEEKMAVKRVTGYNWKDKTHTKPEDRVGHFEFDLTNETGHVSCNALGTYFGKCHNSLQTCINREYREKGFMVVCSNGELVDDDGSGDGIACDCEMTTYNDNGACYTMSACFKKTNWALHRCTEPPKNHQED